ncbi:uncharacterized protein G2W53_034276 [Senna tora]|uniref:Uncharacterized protein n=1 Tax=Senna tora TaxID=362788 RepID=A0A834T275_9FABA|nr:uncharacterized protein G2W53_034276 [Senna tora]
MAASVLSLSAKNKVCKSNTLVILLATRFFCSKLLSLCHLIILARAANPRVDGFGFRRLRLDSKNPHGSGIESCFEQSVGNRIPPNREEDELDSRCDEDLLLNLVPFLLLLSPPQRALQRRQFLHLPVQRCRERHVTLHLPLVRLDLLRTREGPPVRVATRIGEPAEQRVERPESGVVAVEAEPGDGVGEEAEGFGELGGGEAEEEGVVVGDELADAVEGEGVVPEAEDDGVGEGLGEVEELGHEGGDLEGEDSDDGAASFGGGFEGGLLEETLGVGG